MRLRNFARFSFCLTVGLTFADGNTVRADEDLPALRTLPCATACANSTGAVGVTQPLPSYPREFIESPGAYVEGYVRLHYKINTDGHVSDIAIVTVVGPKKFADNTVEAVKGWVYKPATLDGKSVATCHTMIMKFRMGGRGDFIPGGRPEIVKAYKAALESIKDQKFDEAQSALADALSKSKLNLYERGMLANLSSLIALHAEDYLEAHRISTVALEFSSQDLPPQVKMSLLETRLKSALFLGDIVDALESEDRLKAAKGFDSSDPVVKVVEDVRARTDSMPRFGTSAKIPEISEGESTYFGLYRRNFAFLDIKGSLSDFTLNCKQQAIESKITETAEWHVPKSWSDCRILVRGAPGTTFKVAQLTE